MFLGCDFFTKQGEKTWHTGLKSSSSPLPPPPPPPCTNVGQIQNHHSVEKSRMPVRIHPKFASQLVLCEKMFLCCCFFSLRARRKRLTQGSKVLYPPPPPLQNVGQTRNHHNAEKSRRGWSTLIRGVGVNLVNGISIQRNLNKWIKPGCGLLVLTPCTWTPPKPNPCPCSKPVTGMGTTGLQPCKV